VSRPFDMVNCVRTSLAQALSDLGGRRRLSLPQTEVLGYTAHLVVEVCLVLVDDVVEVTEQFEADAAHELGPGRQRACEVLVAQRRSHRVTQRLQVLAILLDAASLPQWNPAFSAVSAEGPATVGLPNPIRVKGVLRGELVYDRISDSEVAITIRIPGLTEQGTWQLAKSAGGTTVTHAFTQSGVLAELLEPSTRNVASLRVNRLRERVANPHAVIS